jgi:7-cyano-7-deazaguanine synthase in queuosine biosynthesis
MDVLLWSGGADSTLILEEIIRTGLPVRPISITKHRYLNTDMLALQYEAQKRYLLSRRGHRIQHETISIDGAFTMQTNPWGQMHYPLILLSVIAPLLKDNDILHIGWIKEDNNIDSRLPIFRKAFNAIMEMKDINAHFHATLHKDKIPKHKILTKLKEYGVNDDCWFSCERPYMGKACNICRKCKEIRDARRKIHLDETAS